jgi:hypothetical protein
MAGEKRSDSLLAKSHVCRPKEPPKLSLDGAPGKEFEMTLD